MCVDCWEAHGSPTHTSPAIQRAADLIRGIYASEPTGSPLHVELDDWNIDREWKPWGSREDLDDPAAWDLAVELCTIMNGLPVADRAAALAFVDGFAPQQEKEAT